MVNHCFFTNKDPSTLKSSKYKSENSLEFGCFYIKLST
jgi:hypothetical protein